MKAPVLPFYQRILAAIYWHSAYSGPFTLRDWLALLGTLVMIALALTITVLGVLTLVAQ